MARRAVNAFQLRTIAEGMTSQRLDHHMNVIRHEAPRQHPISVAIEMEQAVFHDCGDIISMKPAGAQPGIELTINQEYTFVAKSEVCDRGSGKAIGQTKRDELNRLG